MVDIQSNPPRCQACKNGLDLPFAFSMAFQPIVNVATGRVFAYEALVRGLHGESAGSILALVTEENRYAFDQSCRVRAITLAAQLCLVQTGALLSINFMPGAVYSPVACIQLTLETAARFGFPCEKLIFEITESEQVEDPAHLRSIVDEYRRRGFSVALDDLGAGYCGLNLLANLPANIIKLDMELTRNLHLRPRAKTVVNFMVALGLELGMEIVAEGVETNEEYAELRRCGIHLMQGYLFAKPAFEALPPVTQPDLTSRSLETSPVVGLQPVWPSAEHGRL